MVRVAIVEDEEGSVKTIMEYLREYEKINNVEFKITVHRDGDEILKKYKAQFDIILMDIQMKFVDGMEAAMEIRKADSEVIIIFITNMTQYAVKGYEVEALDYIIKPVSYFAFIQMMNRAIDKIKKTSSRFITLPIKGGILRLNVLDIYYIESFDHRLVLHTKDEEHSILLTMKSIEEKLESMDFVRINKSYLINLEHVERIKNKVVTVKGQDIPVSRSRWNQFMQELTSYWGED